MNVLYDYQIFSLQKYGGISRCFAELISHLPSEVQYTLSVKESNNIYISEYGLGNNVMPLSKTVDDFMFPLMFKGKGRLFDLYSKLLPNYPSSINLNKNSSIEMLKQQKYDVFHPTFFDDYFLKYLGDKPFVLTIHDMVPELYPKYYRKTDIQIKNKKELAKQSAHIIAVSQYTKTKIIEILGTDPEKISVIYHGYDDTINFDLIRNKPRLMPFKYFLYMGMRDGYKNFRSFVKEMARVLKENIEYYLVCTGAAFTEEEIHLFNLLGIKGKVVHHFASSFELQNLLVNAEAFIYPSLDEGFGMPILEAFAAGCPVLLNNKSCFPEIAGNAALYFELDGEISTFYECIQSFISYSDCERHVLRQKAYKRLAIFSWNKSACELMNIYKNIAK